MRRTVPRSASSSLLTCMRSVGRCEGEERWLIKYRCEGEERWLIKYRCEFYVGVSNERKMLSILVNFVKLPLCIK